MAQESIVETLEPPASSSSIDQTTTADRSSSSSSSDPCLSRNTSFSRLNAGAAEFVPRTSNRTDLLVIQQAHMFPGPPTTSPFTVPVVYHNYGVKGGGAGFGDHDFAHLQHQLVEPDHIPSSATRNGLPDEISHKIVNQVEYYFSDANLATTDHLIRFINKDPDGFVPISVVASFKKIKALVSTHHQLATVLRTSAKLVVSDDGKKVRRQTPFTESDMEDLQLRIVVAENLPEDHSYQNLMRVFSVIGSVKTIRTCPPQVSNGGASATSRLSKTENMFLSNKLHAFVEYETVELAEKAVSELNDERNWRSGLRVRLLLKRGVVPVISFTIASLEHNPSLKWFKDIYATFRQQTGALPDRRHQESKSAQARTKKAGQEGEGTTEEDDLSTSEQPNDKHSEDHFQSSDATSHEHNNEEHVLDKESGPRRMRGRGRGKGRGWGQHHNNRGNHVGTPPANSSIQNEQQTSSKQPPGPRMPDGTRGFTIGRGKPISDNL